MGTDEVLASGGADARYGRGARRARGVSWPRRDGSTVGPELAARAEAVVDALGVGGALNALDEPETAVLLGIVEGFLAQAADFVIESSRVDRAGITRSRASFWRSAIRVP